MAHIVIFVANIAPGEDGKVQFGGQAQLSTDNGVVGWTVDMPYDATAADINKAIESAAVAAAVKAGYKVEALDVKTFFAGGTRL